MQEVQETSVIQYFHRIYENQGTMPSLFSGGGSIIFYFKKNQQNVFSEFMYFILKDIILLPDN